jgi:hypothetical protein
VNIETIREFPERKKLMPTNSFVGHCQRSVVLVASFALISAIQGVARAQTCDWNTPVPGKITETCGNVGIGTTTPTAGYSLETVGGPIRSTRVDAINGPQSALSLVHQTSGQMIDGYGVSMVFYHRDVDAFDNLVGRISTVRDGGDALSKMVFKIGASGGETERFQITNTGVSAIGVPLTANYADLAEWVSVTGSSDPGTVVVIHGGGVNEVEPARKAYDTSVAGVISAKPGIILGEAGDGKATIATTGRVKVKVDASKAPIRIGDLLVTSDREGFAMRSEPVAVAGIRMHRPGTLIGKALEPLDSGEGEILVLLSLQ